MNPIIAHIPLFSLIYFLIGTAATAQTDLIQVAVLDHDNRYLIESYTPQGERAVVIELTDDFHSAKFLGGRWLPTADSSVLALKENDKKQFSAYILDQSGAAVKSFALGKNIKRLVALDFDGSGVTDLALQQANGRTVVYLAPGINGSTVPKKVKIPRRNTILPIPGPNSDILGSFKSDPPGFGNKKSRKGHIEYRNERGKRRLVRLRAVPQSILALRTTNGSPAFALVNKKLVNIVGTETTTRRYNKHAEEEVLSGRFIEAETTTLLFGTKKGGVTLLNPNEPEGNSSFRILVRSPEQAFGRLAAQSSPLCAQYERLQNSLLIAMATGNFSQAMRLAQQLAAMETQYYQLCILGSGLPDVDQAQPQSTFVPGEAAYISSNILDLDATAGAGPCSVFQNPQDGSGGFVAKNSDSYRGSVYLTKYGYSNGRILNPVNYKVIEKMTYTGIANGARAHFRSNISLPRGNHIFAADLYGETHCWRIPDGYSRLD